jgi:hypothetical protein
MTAQTDLSPELARELWKRAENERAFWDKHYPEFLERYPDQFVAVKNGEVVANAPDLTQLVVLLESKGIDLKKVWAQFISEESHRLIL